ARDHVDAAVVRVEDLADDANSLPVPAEVDRDRVADGGARRRQETCGDDDLTRARVPAAADEVVAGPARRAAECRDRNRLGEARYPNGLVSRGDDVEGPWLGVHRSQDRALRHGRRRLRPGRALARNRDDRRADPAATRHGDLYGLRAVVAEPV